jgi:hypothetical protein
MATTVYRGLNLNWGTTPGTVSTAFGNCKVQTGNMTRTGDELEIRDEIGDQVSWVGYGVKRTATFTYYVANSGTANGTETVSAPSFGDMCTLNGSTKFPWLSGVYIAKDVSISTTNTDATKVDVSLVAYPNITA